MLNRSLYINRKNIYRYDGTFKNKPKQWAALGFNLRVTDSTGTSSILKPERLSVASGVQVANLQNKFYVWAYIEAITAKNKAQCYYLAEDTENFDADTYCHTERAIRSKMLVEYWDWEQATKRPYDRLTKSVYMYTYSTPCFRGCARDVFGQIQNLVESTLNPTGQHVDYYLGLHSQYHNNDDLQVWEGYKIYQNIRASVQDNSPAQFNSWNIVPLEDTLQTFIVRSLLKTKFCEKCQLKSGASDFMPLISDARARAINYVVEAIIWDIAEAKCNELGTSCKSPNRQAGNPWVLFRNIDDWLERLKVINSDPYAYNIHSDFFTAALKDVTDGSGFFPNMDTNTGIDGPQKRIVVIGPPDQPRDFYPAILSPQPYEANWGIECQGDSANDDYEYGWFCEYFTKTPPSSGIPPDTPPDIPSGSPFGIPVQFPTSYPVNIMRSYANIDPAYIDNQAPNNKVWIKLVPGQKPPAQPGIFFVYGAKDWPNRVHFIGGGKNLQLAWEQSRNKLAEASVASPSVYHAEANPGSDNNNNNNNNNQKIQNKHAADAQNMVFRVLKDFVEPEVIAYVNLLKSSFCAFAHTVEDNGPLFYWKCQNEANPVAILQYFDTKIFERFVSKSVTPQGSAQPISLPSIPQRLLGIAPADPNAQAFYTVPCLVSA
eukprot:Phypoly_transcript_04863.p1 GENE.Phypoly_transcript_04863~~Phypoly_transcript_04863.p1  ORF type:complete len:658 (+),score=84.44 Phypoly_transcript_04863:32-2005(+)